MLPTLIPRARRALLLSIFLAEAFALRGGAALSQILRWEIEGTVVDRFRSDRIFPDLRLGDPVRGFIAFDLMTMPDSNDPNDVFYLHPSSIENVGMVIENPRAGTEITFTPDPGEPSGVEIINNLQDDNLGIHDSVSALQYVAPPPGSTGIVTALGVQLFGPPTILSDTRLPTTLDLDDWPNATISFFELSDLGLPSAYVYAEIHKLTQVDQPRLPGDFNGDDMVDAADYVEWRNGLLETYTAADYNIWRQHFGEVSGDRAALLAPESRVGYVPEPPTSAFLSVVLAMILYRRA